jgi:hypothetical protein
MKPGIRNGMIAGATAFALLAAGSVTAPVEAKAGDRVAGALLGGFVAGAVVGSLARPVYAAPVYAAPVYRPRVVYGRPAYAAPVYVAPRCRYEHRQVWDPYYGDYVIDRVRVCY